jgi:hypothetical protein
LALFFNDLLNYSMYMKRIFTLLTLAVLAASFSKQQMVIDDVLNGFRNADAGHIAKHFDNTLEMTLPDGRSGSYSKAQAEQVLKDFFKNHPVKGFQSVHKGENSGNQFCIGTLQARTGNYRTTIYMGQRGDKQLVQEVKLER